MNKILIITGGSRGIGEKTIACFLQNGWQAINISRSPCEIDSVTNFNIDLSDSRNINKYVNKLHQAIGKKSIISLITMLHFTKKIVLIRSN